jgi:hypothetical protein
MTPSVRFVVWSTRSPHLLPIPGRLRDHRSRGNDFWLYTVEPGEGFRPEASLGLRGIERAAGTFRIRGRHQPVYCVGAAMDILYQRRPPMA